MYCNSSEIVMIENGMQARYYSIIVFPFLLQGFLTEIKR